MPMNVCEASLNREKSNCLSNLVAVGINVGEASAGIVGLRVGDISVVGARVAVNEIGVDATCDAQAVTIAIETTINRQNTRLGRILISFLTG
jgi:hypothetical protein